MHAYRPAVFSQAVETGINLSSLVPFVTVTPFLYHLVQGSLPYTHVNRILLYARTSLVRFCSEYVSLFFVILLELALIDSLFFSPG